MRAEFSAIAAGFALLPILSGNAGKAVVVNGTGTGLTVTTGQLALAGNLTTTGAFNTTLAQGASVTLTLPLVDGTLATLSGTETLSNKTFVTPALGTPASGVLTNCTGTAAGLTAGNVTTNANLTGPITSVGNATAVASQTGTGTTFVMNTSPTLVTPNIGAATGTSLSASGTVSFGTGSTISGQLTGGAGNAFVKTLGSGGLIIQINGTSYFQIGSTGVHSLGGVGGGESLRAVPVTSSTIWVEAQGSAAGSPKIASSSTTQGLAIGDANGTGLTVGFISSKSQVVGTWPTSSAGLPTGAIWNNAGVANFA